MVSKIYKLYINEKPMRQRIQWYAHVVPKASPMVEKKFENSTKLDIDGSLKHQEFQQKESRFKFRCSNEEVTMCGLA